MLISLLLNTSAIFAKTCKFTSIFKEVISVILVLFFLLVVEDIVQDTTLQIKGYWRFLNSIHLYIIEKNFGRSFAFDAPTVWNDLPYEVCSVPPLTCFRKNLKSDLFKKAFPP